MTAQKNDRYPGALGAVMPLLLIAVLGFIVYANSLGGDFVWDDNHLIRDNVYIKKWAFLAEIFTRHIGTGANIEYFSYRPLQMLSYMADYFIWGINPLGYHLTNVTLHIFAAFGVYWMVRTFFGRGLLPFFTAALFVAHPVHTAAVAYASGRADPLALIFMLSGLIFYSKSLDKGKIVMYCAALLCFVLALLSRESSIIFPVLLILYHYCSGKRVRASRFLPAIGLAIVYVTVRLTLLSELLTHVVSASTVRERLPGAFAAITGYIRLMVFPVGLHMDYGNALFSFTDQKAVAGILITAVFLGIAFRKRKTDRILFFSVVWFFAALLPVANIYPVNAYMAEHWLYVPSIGFFIILGRILSGACLRSAGRMAGVAGAAVVLLFYSWQTIEYNRFWRTPLLVYQRTLEYSPQSVRALAGLAREYHRGGKNREAIALSEKALLIDPFYGAAYSNMGKAWMSLGEAGKAVDSFEKAVELDPERPGAYNNLGIAYLAAGNAEEAISAYRKAIELNPRHGKAYNNLGNLYLNSGKHEDAVEFYEQAVNIDPDMGMAYFNLSLCFSRMGDNEMAEKYREMAAERGYVLLSRPVGDETERVRENYDTGKGQVDGE